jgi:CxxC motif-containing protein (DUF1111 family)
MDRALEKAWTMQASLSHRAAPLALSFIALVWLAGCESRDSGVTNPPPHDALAAGLFGPSPNFGEPLPGLTTDELTRFILGKEEFEEEETVAAGLGPVFNNASCATCHDLPVGGTTGRTETRFGRTVNGVFDPLVALGGSLRQDQAIGAVADSFVFTAEQVPGAANVTAGRITTQLFGLGLVDAVPDSTLLQLAGLQATLYPATAGTPSIMTEISTGRIRVGRFGWKAQNPTLFQFAGDAYVNELGITNPEFPDENCPQGDCSALAHNPAPGLNDDGTGVQGFADFMTLLAPPPRGPVSVQAQVGSGIFGTIGCADCHTPVLVTGDSPVAALSHKEFQPFSDFLLHDMGSLGDGIVQGSAGARQMRTAPLWGVRTRSLLLHDGRATSLEAAILAHDGQARPARDRFTALDAVARQALIAFLKSL